MTPSAEPRGRLIGALALILLGLWILQSFLVSLTWAVIIGLATWPLYAAIERKLGARLPSVVLPLVLTLAIAGILFGPITYGLLRLADEVQSLVRLLNDARQNGITVPNWLGGLPMIGEWAQGAWARWLGSPDAVRESLHAIPSGEVLNYTRSFAAQLVHRYTAAFFTVVALFFVYRDGAHIGRQVLALGDRLFGTGGSRYALHAVSAVSATVNGIVLVALGQGVLLGFGYAVAGLPHATFLGAVTGLMAFVPFAAKLMFVGASLVLFGQGHIGAGAGLIVYGLVIILTADNYIRPALIGGAVRLPFLWTLFGILGGIETFGLLGLFLGPTVMAILMSVWRDSLAAESPTTGPEPLEPAPCPDRHEMGHSDVC